MKLSGQIGIAESTLSEILRAAERRIIESALGISFEKPEKCSLYY
jgi:predicted DNA binding protein